MSVRGRWRIVEMPDYTDDYPDMMEPAYILFEDHGCGEFAFGCVTGQVFGAGDTDAVEFSWRGNDEMDEAPRATDGQNSSPTAPSRAKSASTAATTPTSSPAVRLLQQPASGHR